MVEDHVSKTLKPFDFNQIKQRFEAASSELVRAKFDYIFKLKVLEFYFGITISIQIYESQFEIVAIEFFIFVR